MTRASFDVSGAVDAAGLEAALGAELDAEVRFDAGSTGACATDGSHYRQVPIGVVVPRTVEAGARAVHVYARFGAPVLKGDSDRAGMVRQGFKAKVQEFLPGHRHRADRPGAQDDS